MIIVPTEKEFDWKHAPIVLFFIVLLNLLTFFLYQSRDTVKLMDVVTSYQAHEFFEKEWPAFEKYLQTKNETQLLADYREAYSAEAYDIIIHDLLLREDFYVYLEHNSRDYFSPDDHDMWAPERARIHAVVQTISFISNGLIASQLSISDFLTHQFLHGDLEHLLGNMFFLIICGFAVEAAIGHWRFLGFYLLSGLGAGFAQVASDWSSTTPLVGASGAISGVMAMYLAVFRFKKIEFFYWFFFFVGYFRAPALLILPFYIGKEVFNYLHDTESNIAFMAHAGGFVTGALSIGGALIINRNMLNHEYIEEDQKTDPKQKELAEIYDAIEKFRFEKALEKVDLLIAEKGMDFELGVLRYNILKITRDEKFDQASIDLCKLQRLSHQQLRKLNTIVVDNPQAHDKIDDQSALKIAIQLANVENPKASEQLFEVLQKRQVKHVSMGVLATKLARAFMLLRDNAKKTHYENLAQSLSGNAERGLL